MIIKIYFQNRNGFSTAWFILLLVFLQCGTALAQSKQVEKLKRGLVVVAQDDGYYLSWRLLGNDSYDTGFNVYRDGERINELPINDSTTYFDQEVTGGKLPEYRVRAIGEDQPLSSPGRVFSHQHGNNAAYLDIALNPPSDGPEGGTYSPNDASVGDLDGDGEYEIILKWSPSTGKDNSHKGITDPTIIDAYNLNGKQLWRINLGPNIRAGAHYTQFMVYDFDGNGKAEIMMKTAPGTKDGTGQLLSKGPAADVNHGKVYRNGGGYILKGPEFLSVFEGQSGRELATTNYVPPRGNITDWGDDYGNRVDRFLAGVAYLDGRRPSAVFARGYYTRMVVAAWDWRDGKLTRRWIFDTDDPEYDREWEGQGNHQLSVVDADNDGMHEIVYGAVVIDEDGKGIYTTGLGHGDALHATHMIKDDSIPQIFTPHEWDKPGVTLRNADDGSMLFKYDKPGDIGRGVAAELDPKMPGFKFWASSGMGLYDLKGKKVGAVPPSANHIIWFNGDLSRELLNRNTIKDWDIQSDSSNVLLEAEGAESINWTKANPNLQADILGDWREEVIFRTADNQNLRIYISKMPTSYRLYTFMHDPVYRVAIAWQNSGYNQPPHPGFYVASDMELPPPMPQIFYPSEVFHNIKK